MRDVSTREFLVAGVVTFHSAGRDSVEAPAYARHTAGTKAQRRRMVHVTRYGMRIVIHPASL
jgi:hypothetical protein